ncbi:MAG: TIGR03986 family CRISPR-associated RAMP protein [Caldilineaceae bacterium]
MAPNKTNQRWPQHHNPRRKAVAPYNFVPLPERAIYLDPSKISGQDRYSGQTGYVDCTLQTLTPLYTRTALNPAFFAEWGEKIREMMANEQARQQYADFFHLGDPQVPVIPGSTLRGMIRTLMEIVGYGKIEWVTDSQKITFRSVAAPNDDPLKDPYEKILGKYGRNVRTGYLRKIGERWWIQPAKTPQQLGLAEQDKPYLQVKKSHLVEGDIPNLLFFDDANYRPQYHAVCFKAEARRGQKGSYTFYQVGNPDKQYIYKGTLVCTGNMDETGGGNTPRKKYAIVLEADLDQTMVAIDELAVQDYLDSLTDFQREAPFDQRMGCLVDGRPIFYVPNGRNKVRFFGHCPNFRVPACHSQNPWAVTPLDLTPPALRHPYRIDLADTIFGYVKSQKQPNNGRQAVAGRIFFTDATFVGAKNDLWVSQTAITPKVLASPKPTTFQHYLVQDRERGHSPDNRRTLAHYGTATPEETVIRGHKLYWHKKDVTQQDLEEHPDNCVEDWAKDTQHTQIRPVNAGVTFAFRIYFENLTTIELGALLWVLTLPAQESEKRYRHKLGMGKALGMGSIHIKAQLVLSRRRDAKNKDEEILLGRYHQLLDGDQWYTPERPVKNIAPYLQAFEKFVLTNMQEAERGEAQSLATVKRIQLLLKLLEWTPGVSQEHTRYMTIQPDNEFKQRLVLPDPEGVASR